MGLTLGEMPAGKSLFPQRKHVLQVSYVIECPSALDPQSLRNICGLPSLSGVLHQVSFILERRSGGWN